MDAAIREAKEWTSNDPNPTTTAYVLSLLEQAREGQSTAQNEVQKLFPGDGSRIAFGTAGLRATMRPGPLSMNDLTVVQTAQGLAKYCLSEESVAGKEGQCVVIGYDHRSHPEMNISSLTFAILTTLAFQHVGINTILLNDFVMTPLVPFAVKVLGASAGIMVTASHNPKEDNGYKVYANDACQIRSPMDADISKCIQQNLSPWVNYQSVIESHRQQHPQDLCLGLSSPDKTKELLDGYFKALLGSGLKTNIQDKHASNQEVLALSPPMFAYTAMHGIGHPFAERVFKEFELPEFRSVVEQCQPDCTFPTASFPNPEEKGALDLAKGFAESNDCDVVLANDPDADRLAVAERDRDSGHWAMFSGDQIGTMLGHWLWTQIGKHAEKRVSMCASTVSSKMLAEIARVEGFHFEDTLTGFKWIGSRSAALHNEGYHHLFGYEEAIGFACGNVIFDKDGISAMAVFAQMTLSVYGQGRSLKQHMQSLYDKYGEFVSHNGYYFMKDPTVVGRIMARVRAAGGYNLDLGPYKIESIRDLEEPGYDSTKPDKVPTLPTSKSAPMMTLGFTNGCIVQLRPSGTEPKFKFYMEMKGNPGVDRNIVEKELSEMASFVLEKLLEPSKNGLQ